jgi:hypothetical protein
MNTQPSPIVVNRLHSINKELGLANFVDHRLLRFFSAVDISISLVALDEFEKTMILGREDIRNPSAYLMV